MPHKIEKLNIEQSFPATDGITKVMANKIDELITSCECRFKALDSCPGELVDCDCVCHKKVCEMCQAVDDLAPSETWCKTHNYSRKEEPQANCESCFEAGREKGFKEGVEKCLEKFKQKYSYGMDLKIDVIFDAIKNLLKDF